MYQCDVPILAANLDRIASNLLRLVHHIGTWHGTLVHHIWYTGTVHGYIRTVHGYTPLVQGSTQVHHMGTSHGYTWLHGTLTHVDTMHQYT